MAEIIASPDNLSSYLWDIALGMSAGLLSFKVNGYPLSSGLLVIGLVASAGIFALDFVSLVSMGLRRMRITMRRLGTRVARVAGMRVRGPNGLMIAIRGSIGTVVAAGVHRTLVMTLRRPSAVRPILVMLHGPASVRPVVVPRFSSRYHIAPFELARSSAGSNYRASVIFRGPLSAIGARGVFMFDLLSARFEVMLVLRDPFALAYASLDPVRTAIEADAIDIVHYHRAVVVNNVNRVSFNGGPHGIQARISERERIAEHEHHFEARREQIEHEHAARADRRQWASENHGRPVIAASGRPGAFKGRDVVAAREARHDDRPNGRGPVEHHEDRPNSRGPAERHDERKVNAGRNDRPNGPANRDHEPVRTANPHTSNARDARPEPSHGNSHAAESHGNKGHEVQRENPGRGDKPDHKKP